MLKYKVGRKLIEVKCEYCGSLFEKPLSEYNRNAKLSRSNYCSRFCSGASSNKHGKQKGNYHSKFRFSPRDEFTPFRYYYRNAKKRFHEFNLTLEYLRELWLASGGVCPYSGVQLVLAEYNKHHHNPFYKASLDRIDSSKGYVIGNVQYISTAMNYMKSTMSHEDTLAFIRVISDNFLSARTISSPSIAS